MGPKTPTVPRYGTASELQFCAGERDDIEFDADVPTGFALGHLKGHVPTVQPAAQLVPLPYQPVALEVIAVFEGQTPAIAQFVADAIK